jgi:hypothetical protein
MKTADTDAEENDVVDKFCWNAFELTVAGKPLASLGTVLPYFASSLFKVQ